MTAIRPLSTREVLTRAVAVYRDQFPVLFVTSALLGLPATVLGLGTEPGPPTLLGMLAGIAGGLLGLLATVAVTIQVATALRGDQPTLAAGVAAGASRLLPVLGAMLWTSIFVAVAAVLPMAVILGGVAWLSRPEASGLAPATFALVVTLLALVFVTVLGTLAVRYFAVLPIATLESARGVLGRSAALARGAYWKIGVVWCVGGLLVVLPMLAVGMGVGLGAAYAHVADGPAWLLPAAGLLSWLVTALGTPFTAALCTVLYLDRRVRTDGPDGAGTAPSVSGAPAPGALPRPVTG